MTVIVVPQLEDPTGQGRCFLAPSEGPKVMVHCVEPAGHAATTPHTWEKSGLYTHDGKLK